MFVDDDRAGLPFAGRPAALRRIAVALRLHDPQFVDQVHKDAVVLLQGCVTPPIQCYVKFAAGYELLRRIGIANQLHMVADLFAHHWVPRLGGGDAGAVSAGGQHWRRCIRRQDPHPRHSRRQHCHTKADCPGHPPPPRQRPPRQQPHCQQRHRGRNGRKQQPPLRIIDLRPPHQRHHHRRRPPRQQPRRHPIHLGPQASDRPRVRACSSRLNCRHATTIHPAHPTAASRL